MVLVLLTIFSLTSHAQDPVLTQAKVSATSELARIKKIEQSTQCSTEIQRQGIQYVEWFLDHFAEFEKLSQDFDREAASIIQQFKNLPDPTIETVQQRGHESSDITRKALFESTSLDFKRVRTLLPMLNSVMNQSLSSETEYELKILGKNQNQFLAVLIHTQILNEPIILTLIYNGSDFEVYQNSKWSFLTRQKVSGESADALIRLRESRNLKKNSCAKMIALKDGLSGVPFLSFEEIIESYIVYHPKPSQENNFINRLLTVDTTTFPDRDLLYTSVEEEQIKLISCVRTMIQKRRGGEQTPMQAHDLLMKAMNGNSITRNKSVLAETTARCNEIIQSHRKMRKRNFRAVYEQFVANPSNHPKVMKLIQNLHEQKSVYCKLTLAGAEMYWIFGGGAGVHQLKCIMSDGRVRNYAGVNIKVGVGGGLMAGVSMRGSEDDILYNYNSVAGTVSREQESFDMGEKDAALLVGKTFDRDGNMDGGFQIGLCITGSAATFGPIVRVWDGETRWKMLLDILK